MSMDLNGPINVLGQNRELVASLFIAKLAAKISCSQASKSKTSYICKYAVSFRKY